MTYALIYKPGSESLPPSAPPVMSLSVDPSLLQELEEKYRELKYEEVVEHGKTWMIIYRYVLTAQ